MDPSNEGILFTFPHLIDYEIRARFRQDGDIIRIEEILSIKRQGLGFQWIDVTSPNYRVPGTSSTGKRKKIIIDDENELIIDVNSSGSQKAEKIVEILTAENIFEDHPTINRIPYKNGKSKSIDKSERLLVNTKGSVSAADFSSNNTMMGIEFKELDQSLEKFDEEIKLFLSIIEIMSKRYKDINVFHYIGHLPEGNNGKKFSKLDNGVTPRKYVFVKVTFNNGSTIYLIEIERNGRSLSTIALINNYSHDNEFINIVVNDILFGLVRLT
jgi:hypothetical protein